MRCDLGRKDVVTKCSLIALYLLCENVCVSCESKDALHCLCLLLTNTRSNIGQSCVGSTKRKQVTAITGRSRRRRRAKREYCSRWQYRHSGQTGQGEGKHRDLFLVVPRKCFAVLVHSKRFAVRERACGAVVEVIQDSEHDVRVERSRSIIKCRSGCNQQHQQEIQSAPHFMPPWCC